MIFSWPYCYSQKRGEKGRKQSLMYSQFKMSNYVYICYLLQLLVKQTNALCEQSNYSLFVCINIQWQVFHAVS